LNVEVFVAASPCSSVKFDSTGVLAFPGLGLSLRPAHSFVAAANGDSVLIAYEKTSAIAAALLRTDGAHVEFIEMEFIVAQGNVSRPLVVASDDGFIIAYNVAESQTTRHIEAVRIGAQPPIPRHRGVR